jgi:CRP-like cAMP-binding protein
LKGLSADQVAAAPADARQRTYKRGATVFHQGDEGDSVHVVVKGHFAFRLETPQGDAGETFEISRAQVKQIRTQHPEVVNAIIEIFSHEVHWLAQRLLEVLYVDADKRVRRRLVELQPQYAEGPGGTPIRLTQEDLAGLAGTSRSTVNRVLRAEEQRGTLSCRRGRIVLQDTAQIARGAE